MDLMLSTVTPSSRKWVCESVGSTGSLRYVPGSGGCQPSNKKWDLLAQRVPCATIKESIMMALSSWLPVLLA
eukprot:8327395-Heterocapsa_arctica.AAC.1